MTRADILDTVRILLGETDATNSFFNDTDIENLINRWMPQISSETEALLTYTDYTTTAGTQQYPLPSDYLKGKMASIQISASLHIPLEYLSMKQFEHFVYGAVDQQGQPNYYKIELGAVIGTNDPPLPGDVWLYPIPDLSTYTLRLYYYQKPTDIAIGSGGDALIPELPEFLHPAIAYKVAALLAFQNKDYTLADRLDTRYENDIRKAKMQIVRSQRDRARGTADVMGYGELEFGSDNTRPSRR